MPASVHMSSPEKSLWETEVSVFINVLERIVKYHNQLNRKLSSYKTYRKGETSFILRNFWFHWRHDKGLLRIYISYDNRNLKRRVCIWVINKTSLLYQYFITWELMATTTESHKKIHTVISVIYFNFYDNQIEKVRSLK